MGEKIKDLVYDFSDIIISLIIITMIFGVVSWKISDSMTYTSFTDQSSKASLEKKDAKENESTESTTVSTTGDNNTTADNSAAATTNTTAPATTGGKPAASGNSQTAATTTTPVTTAPVATAPTATTAPTEFKVEIPSGSAGISIAKILKEKGIISDTKMFITRVDQLKMGPKLKAGSFTIKAGSTLDDVIYILAGKKK